MDSQSEHSQSEEQAINIAPLTDKYDKVLNLNHQVRAEIDDLTKKAIRKTQINSNIDPRNQARPYQMTMMRQNIQFENFMTKKKNERKKIQAFQIIQDMLEEKGHKNVSTLSDRQPRSVMVVRFVNKIQNQPNVMQIEDHISKERQKIIIKQGVAWIGLICAIEAVYENQMYRLERIIDLSLQTLDKNKNGQLKLHSPFAAFRILMVKGPFWKSNGKQNVGIQLLVNEVESLRYKQNIRIDLLVVMGPILSQANEHVKNSILQNNFQDEFQDIVQTLKQRMQKVLPDIQILLIPSTDDATSIYPIPQPPYDFLSKNQVKLGSNPCSLYLSGSKRECKINFINYDLISYIDSSKCGRPIKESLLENIETYLKQPFYITNTLEDTPLDETNLNSLFNKGQFGDIIVMSSQHHPAFARKINGKKVFVNIGSLGMDYHTQQKHFLSLVSIYQGEGQICQRVKVESISM